MFKSSSSKLLLLLSLTLPAATACGARQDEPKVAQVKPGDMPAGGNWTGVYYSPHYGYLHLVKEGNTVSGKWRTTAGEKWGEMSGEAEGDVFRFEWTEHTIGMVGPTSTTKGKGYFKYVAPPGDDVPHEIHGERGMGSDNAGDPWEAIKQANMNPDPDSVMPDETQRYEPDSWDQPAGGQKAPSESEADDSGGGEEEEEEVEEIEE